LLSCCYSYCFFLNKTVDVIVFCRLNRNEKYGWHVRYKVIVTVIQWSYAPVNILPTQGGCGGRTRVFRQKTIPDRREFDKLMEFGSRVIDFGQFLHPLFDAPSRLKVGDLDFKHFKMLNCPGSARPTPPSPCGQNNNRCISFKSRNLHFIMV